MSLRFTTEQFLSVFKKYNLSVWPMQVVLVLHAILAIILSIRRINRSDEIISIILGFFWLGIGIVYHIIFFTSINKAAYFFGALYIIQGLLFLYVGGLKSKLSFKFHPNSYGIVGSLFILYALIIYPVSWTWVFFRSCLSQKSDFWSSLSHNNFHIRDIVMDR